MVQGTKNNQTLLTIAAIVAAIALIFAGYTWWMGASSSAYKAVFLESGQVYFGKVVRHGGSYLTLREVFYLTDPTVLESSDATTDISLVKLGREVHAPTDTINISRDHIVMLQTLSADSKVLKAILQYSAR